MYLTANHQTPPAHIIRNGETIAVAPLIERRDTEQLLDLGIYLHITDPGDAPLGYDDWVLTAGVYTRLRADGASNG
jgi:hypothetical protein